MCVCGAASHQRAELCSLRAAKGNFCHSLVSNMPGFSVEDDPSALLVFPQGQLELEQSSRASGLGMAAGSIPGEFGEGRRLVLLRPSSAREMEMSYCAFGWMSLGTVLSLRGCALISPVTAWGFWEALAVARVALQRAFQLNLQPGSSFHFQHVPPLPFPVCSHGAITQAVSPAPPEEAI